MGLTKKEWEKRMADRKSDNRFLTHLVKGRNDEDAFNTLLKVLEEKNIKSTFARRNNIKSVYGEHSVVCFQDLSIKSIRRNLEADEKYGATMYCPFGIQLEKIYLFNEGARPVIYSKKDDPIFQTEENWRCVNLDLNYFNIIDWTHEREWRIKGDVAFQYPQIRILVKSEEFKKRLKKECNTSVLDNCQSIKCFYE